MRVACLVSQKRSDMKKHELDNTSSIVYADPAPSDTSFIDNLTVRS